MNSDRSTLNVGIVGLGKMGLLHAGLINSLNYVKIVAISEKDKLLSKYIKSSLPHINIYNNYESMFESENLDMVYITTPIMSHFPIALRSIRNGLNIFVEKPLASNLEETRILCSELTKRNNSLVSMVGYNRRFISTFGKAKSLLDRKLLGDISYVNASMFFSSILSKPSGWRSKKKIGGGGVLLDLGAHIIDLLLWYFSSIDEVSGTLNSIYSEEVEDTANMRFRFRAGFEGVMDTSWSVRGYRVPELNVQMTGSNGKMQVNEDFVRLDLKDSLGNLGINDFPADANLKELTVYKQQLSKGVFIDLGGPEYSREDEHMVECSRSRKQSLINIPEASRTQSVLQAMYDAASSGQTQKVDYIG